MMKNREDRSQESGELHPVHKHHDGYFNTISGTKVSIHNPTKDMILIEDIAHALSNLCRFGGHTERFYSVSQHCILTMKLAESDGHSPDLQLFALMHDASEAYVQDLIKPVKYIVGKPYELIEDRFEFIICSNFNLNDSTENRILVKEYDKTALELEHEYFFKQNRAAFLHWNQYGVYPPEIAKRNFLSHFHRLKKEVSNE